MATVNSTEPDNTFSQAATFTLDDMLTGTLSSISDWDYFKVVMTGSGIIKFDISAAEQSNWAYTFKVYDSAQNVIASNYLGYVDSSSFSVAAPSAGTYYIGVTSNNIHSSFPYTIVTSAVSGSVADYEKESNNTQATATAVSMDRVVTGRHDSDSDVDYFSMNADSAGYLIVDFQAPEKYSFTEYKVSVYDSSGNLIDSRTAGGHMTLINQVGSAGKYFVRIEETENATYQGSDYKFVAHLEASSTLSAAPALTNATAVSGSITSASQHNWYKLSLTAGTMYEFSVSGAASGAGTLATPSLSLCSLDGRSLENSTNLPTYSNGSTVYTADPQIAFVAPYTGTYYLIVDGLGGAGSYTVQQNSTTLTNLIPSLLHSVSGDSYRHWGSGAVGSSAAVTYGFMTSSSYATLDGESGFIVMNESQKQAVREVLAMYSTFANISFTEITDLSSAQIRYGTSNQAGVSSGVAYSSWDGSGALRDVDVFINNTASSSGGTPASESMYKGGAGYETLIHEIGHALGLKHPGNYNSTSGSGTPPYSPAAWDSTAYSTMSYIDDLDYQVSAHTPAWLDIAAVQYLYGARSAGAAQTLTFSATGEFRQSVLSDGGEVILDFSNQTTDCTIFLVPNTFSSIGRKSDGTLAHHNLALPSGVNVKQAVGGSGNDYMAGKEGNEILSGGAGNDIFIGTSGKDGIYGGSGTDKLMFSVVSTQERILKLRSNTIAVADTNGNAVLCRDVELMQFADGSIDVSSLGIHDSVDQTLTQIYVAAFRRAPEAGGYNYWMQEKAAKGIGAVADIMFSLDVVKAIYPTSMTSTEFVTAIYQNVFNKTPDAAGLNYWVQELATKSRGQLVINMTDAALGVPDGTSGKDYFQNRVDWALYAVGYQIDKSKEFTPDHMFTLMNGITADALTVATLIGQAEAGVTI